MFGRKYENSFLKSLLFGGVAVNFIGNFSIANQFLSRAHIMGKKPVMYAIKRGKVQFVQSDYQYQCCYLLMRWDNT